MSILYDAEDLDLLTLNTPGVYVRIIRPPGYIVGQPTNACGILGTASWGPVGVAELAGSIEEAASIFGGSSAVGAADVHDLIAESTWAFAQSQNGISQQQWLVRVAGSGAANSSLALHDTTSGTPKTGGTLTALYPGIVGDQILVYIQAAAAANTFNVVLVPPSPLDMEQFSNIAGGGAGIFWANLQQALAHGIDGLRGPSLLARLSSVDATAIDPAILSGTPLSGGNDGRTVITADFVGSDATETKSGIYALRYLNPVPTVMWCAGVVDSAIIPTMQTFVKSEGMMAAFNTPIGTDIATAQSIRMTAGVDDPLSFFTKDWVYTFDATPGVGKVRLVQPTPFICGRIATLSAASSPYNKQVYGVSGTERTSVYGTGSRKYTPADVARLRNNGCMVITNPVTGGNYWGMPHGNAATSDAVRARIEWARMTNYLAHSIDAAMGPYAGLNQSTRTNDPLRALIKAALDEFLQNLKDQWLIDDFVVVCDKSINSDAMIARGYLRAKVFVRYMSSVQFLIIDLQGGTTVVTVQNNIQPQLAA